MQITIPYLNIRLRFSFWFFAVLAVFVLLAERHILLWYIALPVLIHELGHLIAMAACKIKVREIHFTPVSLRMQAGGQTLTLGQELGLAAGGIAANLAAALFLWLFAFQSMRTMLLIAANLAVAAFNILPIGSLDGGRMIGSLCDRYLRPQAARFLSRLVSFVALIPLTALSVFLLISGSGNFTLALICAYLAVQIILRD